MRTAMMFVAFVYFNIAAFAQDIPVLVKTAKSGAWSDVATWEGGKLPGAGNVVLVRTGHDVVYDIASDKALRAVHISGNLRFATDKDTRLDVGLIKIQAGEDTSEEGFDCSAHIDTSKPGPRPVLEVGSQQTPIAEGKSAIIRLVYFERMNKESLPAIVCCGGRMDFHGTAMNRTWVNLAADAKEGATTVTLTEEVTGWKKGDQIIVTATTRQNKQKKTFKESTKDNTQTEERRIAKIDGKTITLDQPLKFLHQGDGEYKAEVANLSRNVVVESADLKQRGHTMYHKSSAGSIGYTEFRHLGKEGVLGRYSLHFHLVGDTMRGSSVIGASIHDSHNRWLTIHGTNYLVVRDCVGYQSKGHGFFLEDGTEMYNVLDRNLAVQAYTAKPLPKQILPFDLNDGSGFWWSNCHNSFTRNSAAECDEYGYFFQAPKTKEFDPKLPVTNSQGTQAKVDIRTLPFIRFEDNVAHCQRRHGFNMGGGAPFGGPSVEGVGPDIKHPFVLTNYISYNNHWAIHPVSPSLMIDGFRAVDGEYGIWRPVYKDHVYQNVKFTNVPKNLEYAFVMGPPPESKLEQVNDTPPVSIVTHKLPTKDGKWLVRGVSIDNGTIKTVIVNGAPVKSLSGNYREWEVFVNSVEPLNIRTADAAGNVESIEKK